MTTGEYRELNEYECGVLLKLLGFIDLRATDYWEQLRDCRVRIITEHRDNYGSIAFDPKHSLAMPAERSVIEAMRKDCDDIPVLVLLHSRRHAAIELEFVKMDGSPLIERPHPDTLEFDECHRSE